MDSAKLGGLITGTCNALVNAAVTDSWDEILHKIASWFGRGKPDPKMLEKLDQTRMELTAAAPLDVGNMRRELALEWAVRFTKLVSEHPAAADQMEPLLAEITAAAAMAGPGSVVADRGGLAVGACIHAPRTEPPRLPVSLAPRPDSLAGREDLLGHLQRQLRGERRPATVVLCGPGGVGKTILAAEYAHRHLAEVAVAWQLPAGDPVLLTQAMAELAAQLGGRDLADPRDPVASVHGMLAAFPGEWLLIFDDASDEASVRQFLPPAGPGRILITSQNQHWPGRTTVEVAVLDLDVAARFLVSRAGNPGQAAAYQLAGELGGLPLALEQAASYAVSAGMTIDSYLGLFRQNMAETLERGQVAAHPVTVALTLSISLSRLQDESPLAAGLLRLLSCLAPAPVPIMMLLTGAALRERLAPGTATALGPLLEDRLAAADAMAALRRYSLVKSAGPGVVTMHRLVRAIILDQMSPVVVRGWQEAAATLVEAAIPRRTRSPSAWPACAVLLPHARAVLPLTSAGLLNAARYMGYSGSYAAARDLTRQIADACQRAYGSQDRCTLAARTYLAFWTGRSGDPATAADLLAALVPIRERLFGPDHPDTLASRHELAYWTGETGDPAQARDLLAALLPTCERISGPEHRDTLAARNSLAHWTGEAGDAVTAKDLLEALLPVSERVLGAEYPDTLMTRARHASWTGRAGDPARARELFAFLLPVRERVLGPEHPDTLAARHEHAYWTGLAGDPARARELFASLLPVRERVLGPEHPATLSARHNLAHWTAHA